MAKANDKTGPAFSVYDDGMTKREYFASHILGMLQPLHAAETDDELAARAVTRADALIRKLREIKPATD